MFLLWNSEFWKHDQEKTNTRKELVGYRNDQKKIRVIIMAI